MENKSEISKIVSKTLHFTEQGINSKIANMHKNIVQSDSILFTAVHEKFQRYLGGSYAEGTYTPESDIDRMMVIPNITVCSDGHERINRNGHIFQMDSSKCRAGFFTLASQQRQTLEDDLFQAYGKDINDMLEKDEKGNLLLSSEKMSQFSVDFSKRFSPSTYTYSPHGPASTCTEMYSHGFMTGKTFTEIDVDLCFGLLVNKWPAEAEEWVTRQRKYNWPNEDLIKKIRSLDCHLVPVGDKTSQFRHLEWRLSFLLCERELVWSFNDIQLQLYFLLKELLKSELEPLYPDQLSSYCMKTAVFWYSESFDPKEWNEYNLLRLVKDCLLFILSFIESEKLQHYFDRRRNLLCSKFIDFDRKQAVIEKIKEISENIMQTVINLLKQEDVSKAWLKSNGNPKKFLLLLRDVDFLLVSFDKHRYQHDQLSILRGILSIFDSIVFGKIDKLWAQWVYVETHKCNEIDEEFFNIIRKFLAVRVGMSFLSESQKMINHDDYEQNKKNAENVIINATDIDRLSGYLYLATFYLHIKELTMAVYTLARIVNTNEEMSLIYTGQCSRKEGIGMTPSRMLFQTECPFLTAEIGLSASVGFDIMFSARDILYVPYPVKYECALVQLYPEGSIMIHPVIYAYFLMTFTLYDSECLQKSHEYLEKLEIAVSEAEGGCQHFRVLNLLGFCYLLFERFDSVYTCFEYSMKETVGHYQNAAVYHIIILIFDLISIGKLDV